MNKNSQYVGTQLNPVEQELVKKATAEKGLPSVSEWVRMLIYRALKLPLAGAHRTRGRPKKIVNETTPTPKSNAPKRGRGRPKKEAKNEEE